MKERKNRDKKLKCVDVVCLCFWKLELFKMHLNEIEKGNENGNGSIVSIFI